MPNALVNALLEVIVEGLTGEPTRVFQSKTDQQGLHLTALTSASNATVSVRKGEGEATTDDGESIGAVLLSAIDRRLLAGVLLGALTPPPIHIEYGSGVLEVVANEGGHVASCGKVFRGPDDETWSYEIEQWGREGGPYADKATALVQLGYALALGPA